MTAVAMIIAFACAPSARAQRPATEYEIKAAFLFNFAKFVNWPPGAFADSTSPIRIGVLGDDPFGEALEKTVSKQTIDGRGLSVKRSRSIEELKDCQIVFISPSEEPFQPEILRQLEGTPVLTIGETQNFAHRGGVINFVKLDNKVRFEINIGAARAAGLKIDSKLLQLAIVVGA